MDGSDAARFTSSVVRSVQHGVAGVCPFARSAANVVRVMMMRSKNIGRLWKRIIILSLVSVELSLALNSNLSHPPLWNLQHNLPPRFFWKIGAYSYYRANQTSNAKRKKTEFTVRRIRRGCVACHPPVRDRRLIQFPEKRQSRVSPSLRIFGFRSSARHISHKRAGF